VNDPGQNLDAVQWTVWRVDDNGNVFTVREHLSGDEADRVVVEFTARGHKQMYWAERDTPRQPITGNSNGLR